MSRILLVEDQVLFRKALRRVLGQGREERELREVGTARAALDELRQQVFHLMITDLCLPGEDGLWLLSRINEAGLHCATLVVTASQRPELLNGAIRLGARGCLAKNADPSQLLLAVERILQGETYFPEQLQPGGDDLPSLSSRTLELLCHARNGVAEAEIRERMSLSPESFSSLTRSVCRKLSTESLEAATEKAYALGLIAGRDHG